MLAVEGGTVFSCACGYENLAYGIENRLDTAFDTASITKLFTAAGIVLLESRGLLGWRIPSIPFWTWGNQNPGGCEAGASSDPHIGNCG